jgi:hypothetical protein
MMKNKRIEKQYSVAIDTVPLPEKPAERIEVVLEGFEPAIMEIVRDMMYLAIGSWPTPERPRPDD